MILVPTRLCLVTEEAGEPKEMNLNRHSTHSHNLYGPGQLRPMHVNGQGQDASADYDKDDGRHVFILFCFDLPHPSCVLHSLANLAPRHLYQ